MFSASYLNLCARKPGILQHGDKFDIFDFDKNLLSGEKSIGNLQLYVNAILATKGGAWSRRLRRGYIATIVLMENLLTIIRISR